MKHFKNDKDIRVWLLMSFEGERSYAGNPGYENKSLEIYKYDSFVPNNRQISEGDIALLRSQNNFLGVAKIERIDSGDGSKKLFRCPQCNSTELVKRKVRAPIFRCVNGHTFDTPISETVACRQFTAYFGDSFIPAENAISLDELRRSCPKYNRQLAMQRVDFQQIQGSLLNKIPAATKILYIDDQSRYTSSDDAGAGDAFGALNVPPYSPEIDDQRQLVMRQIKARRGQQQFRDALRERYSNCCMITNCQLMDVIDAAHISPYRSQTDNHPENGLLLRTDLHTLFDLNLLGIHPESLQIYLHPLAREAGYGTWEGQYLNCADLRPSRAALESRWARFVTRLQTEMFSGKHAPD